MKSEDTVFWQTFEELIWSKPNLSPDQLNAALSHSNHQIRWAYALFSFQKHSLLTSEQIENGLTDEAAVVRRVFASRADKISITQLERGLTDVDADVRRLVASRKDYSLTREQFDRGLSDPEDRVKLIFARLLDHHLTPEQIECGLSESNDEVREAFISRGDFLPTLKQIARGVYDRNETIQELFLEKREEWKAQNQNKILTEKYKNESERHKRKAL
jgi:hypothetical protein